MLPRGMLCISVCVFTQALVSGICLQFVLRLDPGRSRQCLKDRGFYEVVEQVMDYLVSLL